MSRMSHMSRGSHWSNYKSANLMSRMSRMSQGSGVGIFGQKYKNHVTGTRNTRMSHLSLLCPIMSHICGGEGGGSPKSLLGTSQRC